MTVEHARTNYVAVWGGLLGLLAISLAITYLPFSPAATVTVVFLIATAKAVIVAAYFMHMKFERWVIQVIALSPVALFIMLVLTLIPDIVYKG